MTTRTGADVFVANNFPGLHGKALVLQDLTQELQNGLIIFNDENQTRGRLSVASLSRDGFGENKFGHRIDE